MMSRSGSQPSEAGPEWFSLGPPPRPASDLLQPPVTYFLNLVILERDRDLPRSFLPFEDSGRNPSVDLPASLTVLAAPDDPALTQNGTCFRQGHPGADAADA